MLGKIVVALTGLLAMPAPLGAQGLEARDDLVHSDVHAQGQDLQLVDPLDEHRTLRGLRALLPELTFARRWLLAEGQICHYLNSQSWPLFFH